MLLTMFALLSAHGMKWPSVTSVCCRIAICLAAGVGGYLVVLRQLFLACQRPFYAWFTLQHLDIVICLAVLCDIGHVCPTIISAVH